jgi:hypothetical protein
MQPAAVAEQLTIHAWAALPEDEPGEPCDGPLEREAEPDLIHETAVLWLGTLPTRP